MTPRPITLVHVTTVPQSLRFVAGQAAYIKARGIEVHAVSSPGPHLQEFGDKEGVTVHAVLMPRRITPICDVIALAQLWWTFRRIRPHIVHAHTPKGGLLGILAAWLARIPVRIYHMHGLPFTTAAGLRRRILMTTEAISCRLSTHVRCVSRSVRTLAVEQGLCSLTKSQVLLQGSCNGIDARGEFNPATLDPASRDRLRQQYGIPPQATVIGFVGRLAQDKGVVELASAWPTLRREHPELHLLLIGPEEPGDPPPASVMRFLRSDPRVHFTGENWDTRPLYAAMDILTLPTHREGFPIVLLEAAAMERAIVATQVTGCLDAVQDERTGLLVPARDPRALTQALRRYIVSPELRAQHGAAARAWICRDFSDHTMRAAIYQEYTYALAQRGLGDLVTPETMDGSNKATPPLLVKSPPVQPSEFEPSTRVH